MTKILVALLAALSALSALAQTEPQKAGTVPIYRVVVVARTYDASQIFSKRDTAKLKSAKTLDEAGNFLESNRFGAAVVVAYTGGKGDSEKDKTLTEARSMVVRDYLVKNFKMDDTLVKTMGLGKDAAAGMGGGGGVEILIYPAGSDVPYAKNPDISSHQ